MRQTQTLQLIERLLQTRAERPGSYRFPVGAEVAARWRGSQAELRELATLPELAGFEWRDEAAKMLAAWDAAEARRPCAIL